MGALTTNKELEVALSQHKHEIKLIEQKLIRLGGRLYYNHSALPESDSYTSYALHDARQVIFHEDTLKCIDTHDKVSSLLTMHTYACATIRAIYMEQANRKGEELARAMADAHPNNAMTIVP